jgi:hypothetical protein
MVGSEEHHHLVEHLFLIRSESIVHTQRDDVLVELLA